MKKFLSVICVTLFKISAFAGETYRFDEQHQASEYARNAFGSNGGFNRQPGIDVGSVSAQVYTELDCGKLDINANFKGEFKKIQEQVKKLIPKPEEVPDFISRAAMLTTCYAYPTVCAQLRHDFLSLQGNINLRAKACEAIDKFIDNQASKGAKQLQAEAQQQCASEKISAGMNPLDATEECQGQTGLKIRDFSQALERKFTDSAQKVLKNMTAFARDDDSYTFLAALLGEIEVQKNGYWQPVFSEKMLRPNDVAENFFAEGQEFVCTKLSDVLGGAAVATTTTAEKTVFEVIKKRLTKTDLANLQDLGREDQKLACAALGRAVGTVAAEKALARHEASLASGLLNTAIPNALRDEYRVRGQGAFEAIRKTLAAEQIPPVESVRQAVSNLARATRERNRILAAQISKGRIANSRKETEAKSDCTDTESCEGR